MTEEQLDKKIEQFAGALGELDEATQEKVGRLLMKPEEEDIDANDQTFMKVLQIKGGMIFVIIMSIMQLSLKFVDYHQTRLDHEFATIDINNERYGSFVRTLYLMAVGRILFDMVKDYIIDRRNHEIGKKVRG